MESKAANWHKQVRVAGTRHAKPEKYKPTRDTEMLIRAVCLDGQTREDLLDVHIPDVPEHREMMFARNAQAGRIPWGDLDPQGRTLIEAQVLIAFMLPDMPDWLAEVLNDDLMQLYAVSEELARHRNLFFRRDGLDGEAATDDGGSVRICSLMPVNSDGKPIDFDIGAALSEPDASGSDVAGEAVRDASGTAAEAIAALESVAADIPTVPDSEPDEAQVDQVVSKPSAAKRPTAGRRG